jgi:hypothetical protein
MAISFVETMRGSLRDGEGAEHPVEFRVVAAGLGSELALRGLIWIAPWVEGGEAEGTLSFGLSPPTLGYRLRFAGGLTLEAEKHPTVRAPLRSMTSMHALLRDAAGQTLAEGPMRFDLRDLPQFLASWIPFARRQQRALDAERRAASRQELLGGVGSGR